jgi:hypothetical protein
MELVNLFDIDSPYGVRSFKLFEGDIADIDVNIDMLVTGAFRGGYEPTEGTLLGSLNIKRGIKIEIEKSIIDFRELFGTFYYPVENDKNIKAILVLEIVGRVLTMKEAIENLHITLSILEAKGIKFKKIVMPVIGSGNQNIELEKIIFDLIEFSKVYLEKSICLEQIWLVSNEPEKTLTLNKTMNKILGRSVTSMPISDLINNLKKEIINGLSTIQSNNANKTNDILIRLLKNREPSVLELAIQIRIFLENIILSFLPKKAVEQELFKNINKLKEFSIAPWIISYMHLLRTFSNEYAHSNSGRKSRPRNIVEEDLTIALFAMQRVIDCWLNEMQVKN